MWNVELRVSPSNERGVRIEAADQKELEKLLAQEQERYQVAIVQDGSLVVALYRQHAPGCWRNALAN